MEFPENEIVEIKKFIDLLNSEKDSVVIVEGKRDSAALIKLGYSGKILEFHRFDGMIKFTDFAASSVMILWSVFIVSAKIFVTEFIVDRSKSLLLY